MAGNCCRFELEADLLQCLIIIVLKSWTVCHHQSGQFPLVASPRGCGPCRMEREVVSRRRVGVGKRGVLMEWATPARQRRHGTIE